MDETILTVIGAIIGFLVKSGWDHYSKISVDATKLAINKRIEFIEKQLTHFYWPILFYLKKSDVVWQRIVQQIGVDDPLSRELNNKLGRNFFYPNNQKVLQVIENNYYLAQPDEQLEEQIDAFVRHQSVFQGIKESLVDDVDPIRFGERWPENLLTLIESKTKTLQAEYDKLINNESA